MFPSQDPRTDGDNTRRSDLAVAEMGQLWFLVHASGILSSSLDYPTTLQSVARLAVPLIADWCVIDILHGTSVERLAAVHSDPDRQPWMDALQRIPPDLRKGEGIPSVLRTGRPLFLPEVSDSFIETIALDAKHLSVLRKLDPRSLISVPLAARGRLIGAITIAYSESSRTYTTSDLVLTQELAQRAALAIDNARLYRESESARERFQQLINGLDAIVWEGDPETLCFTFVSKQAEDVLGYPVEAWYERTFWSEHILVDDRDRTVEQCWSATRAGRDHRLLYRMVAADGHVVWISDIVRIGKDADGRPEQLRGVMFDVSHEQELEAERSRLLTQQEQLRAEMVSAQKLDRLKDELINAVSHELRTPITTIIGYTEFLEEGIGGRLSPQNWQFVEQIRNSSRQLGRLVDDLLDHARISAGTFRLNFERADLRDKIREVLGALKIQAEEAGVRLEETLPAEPLVLEMDPQRVGQVLANLLTNAIKFTPAGGRITVRARVEPDAVRCEVEDTGAGIDAEDVPRLFKRFGQLETGRRKVGTGLGLSISKSLVEAHGGTIGVESQKDRGSTFWFTLPLVHRAAARG